MTSTNPVQSRQSIRQIMGKSLTRKSLLAAILLSTALLTAGYLLGQLWLEVPAVFLLGVLWGVCALRDIRWVATLLFAALISATAIGYLAHLSKILMLAAGCTLVLAWDLHYFEGRLLDLGDQATIDMEKCHLQRSLMVLGASSLVIFADSWLRIRIQFIFLILLTIVAILIMNQVMILIRRAGRPSPPK
jgi:hypothetical protein